MDFLESYCTAGFGLLLPLLAFLYTVYQCFFSPLAKIPGPFWAKTSKAFRIHVITRGQSHRDYVSLHKKYGNVVRVAPNELSVTDPLAFREIYRAGNKMVKSSTHEVLRGGHHFDLVSERDERIHSAQRKLVSHAYSMDSVRRYESNIDRAIGALTKSLEGLQGQIFDLSTSLRLFAFDALGEVTFSRSHNFLESGDENGTFQRLRKSLKSASWIVHAGWLFQLHQKTVPVFGNWLAASSVDHGYSYSFASQELAARKDDEFHGADGSDILSQLIAVQEKKMELDDAKIAGMVTTNIFDGPDTTATALSAAFYLLLAHPEVYRKAVSELEDHVGRDHLPGDPVASRQTESCSYFQAVLHEVMRLYPSSGQTLDRIVPVGGMSIGHHFVPEGTVVGTSAWAIHRSPEIWGSDVDDFRPERWLGKESDGLKRFFFAFGGGSRTCLGKNIAWMEISKVLATLLLTYNMELVETSELKETSANVVFLEGLKVRLSNLQTF